MHLHHIKLEGLPVHETSHEVGGMTVWLPYGWSALLLFKLTEADFDELKNAVARNIWLEFPAGAGRYNSRESSARVEVFDREFILKFIEQGALVKPRVAAKLGKALESRVRQAMM
jgi:hypothetical protein